MVLRLIILAPRLDKRTKIKNVGKVDKGMHTWNQAKIKIDIF